MRLAQDGGPADAKARLHGILRNESSAPLFSFVWAALSRLEVRHVESRKRWDDAGMGGLLEPHRVQVVAASLVEVDAGLWNAVRLAVPAHERSPGPAEARIFPVVERGGRLVLLAGFEEFCAVVQTGAAYVNVWRADFEDGASLTEYAVAFSMR